MKDLENRIIALLLLIVLFCGILIPYSIQSVLGSNSIVISPQGTPIEDTPFTNLTSNTLDPALLPHGQISLSTTGSVYMNANPYVPVIVNQSTSVNEALVFVSTIPYLSGLEWQHYNDSAYFFGSTWNLDFGNENTKLSIIVNAVSGRVIHFRLAQDNTGLADNFSSSDKMTMEQVEILALDFLRSNNYSLTSHTRYIGIVEETILGYDAYTLQFCNVVNESLVWFNELCISIHASSGALLSFTYYWHNVDSLPIDRIITAEAGVTRALDCLSDRLGVNDIQIIGMALTFQEISSTFWLCWAAYSDDPNYNYTVYIDAVTGEYRDIQMMGIESMNHIFPSSSVFSINIGFLSVGAVVSVMIGYFGYIYIRRKMKKTMANGLIG